VRQKHNKMGLFEMRVRAVFRIDLVRAVFRIDLQNMDGSR